MATTIKTTPKPTKAKTLSPAASSAAAKALREGSVLIDGKPTFRSFKLVREKIDKEARTVPICFSSEDPGEQWFGREILDHGAGACKLDRLNNGGAVLREHDRRQQIGVVVQGSAQIESDKCGRCVVKFSKSAEGEKELQDVLDGIRTNVSVGYAINDLRFESRDSAGVETYRVTSWEPYEVSIVSIPMDWRNAGVGRESQERTRPITVDLSGQDPEKLMLRKLFVNLEPAGGVAERGQGGGGGTTTAEGEGEGEQRAEGEGEGEGEQPGTGIRTAPRRGVIITVEQARKSERERLKEISALRNRFGANAEVKRYLDEQEFSDTPAAMPEINRTVLQKMASNSKPINTPEIGLSARDCRRYSFIRAIRQAANAIGAGGKDFAKTDAGFEIEIHQECVRQFKAQNLARDTTGLFVPREVMMQRDLVAGTAESGGFLVATELKADSFIEMLRNAMMVRAMGARVITGLVGDVEFPRQNSAGSSYWVGEGSAPTASDQGFGQVAMSPKTVGAFTDMTRKLLMQSSLDVESIVRLDLAQVLGLAIDLAALRGTGSAGQPLGIVNTTGVGSVALGTNGAAPSYANLIALESKVAVANALMGTIGYLTNAKVRGQLKGTERSATGTTGNFVWQEGANGFGEVNGYKAAVSNQVPATLTKGSASGTCSEIYFGNWADLLNRRMGRFGYSDRPVCQRHRRRYPRAFPARRRHGASSPRIVRESSKTL
jgi:HK97 family phage major capsid protein